MKRIYAVAALLAVLCFAGHPVHALTIDEQIREIVRAEIAAALKALPPTVTPTTPPATVPSTPAGPNPFIAWKAEGLELYDIIRFRLGHTLTAAEWDLAAAAGYPRETGITRFIGPAGFPPGFDLTGTETGNGRRNNLAGGIAYTFTFTAPRDGPCSWQFEINPGEMTATRITFDGTDVRDLHEWQRVNFTAKAGQTHRITVQLDGRATVGTVVRYGG